MIEATSLSLEVRNLRSEVEDAILKLIRENQKGTRRINAMLLDRAVSNNSASACVDALETIIKSGQDLFSQRTLIKGARFEGVSRHERAKKLLDEIKKLIGGID